MKSVVPQVVGNVAGGLGAAAIDSMLLPTMDGNLKDGIKVALGIFLPVFVKEPVITGASNALIGVAAYNLSQRFVPGMSGVRRIDQSIAGASGYYRSLGNIPKRSVTDSSIAGEKKSKGVRLYPS